MALDRSVFQQVLTDATEGDLDRLFEVIKQRRKSLSEVRAAVLQVGDKVRIDNITPAALRGTEGEITSMKGRGCTVLLTEDSTDQVRWGRSRRLHVAPDAKRYEVQGVPLTCVFPA